MPGAKGFPEQKGQWASPQHLGAGRKNRCMNRDNERQGANRQALVGRKELREAPQQGTHGAMVFQEVPPSLGPPAQTGEGQHPTVHRPGPPRPGA